MDNSTRAEMFADFNNGIHIINFTLFYFYYYSQSIFQQVTMNL